jgi:hypothetical protein
MTDDQNKLQLLLNQFNTRLKRLIDEATVSQPVQEDSEALADLSAAVKDVLQCDFIGKRSWLHVLTLWDVIASVLDPELKQTVESLSSVDRVDLFIKTALMQQKLGHCISILRTDEVLKFYGPGSIFFSDDDFTVFVSALESLKGIEFNLCLKDASV